MIKFNYIVIHNVREVRPIDILVQMCQLIIACTADFTKFDHHLVGKYGTLR
jgi:hypothetical protein